MLIPWNPDAHRLARGIDGHLSMRISCRDVVSVASLCLLRKFVLVDGLVYTAGIATSDRDSRGDFPANIGVRRVPR